MNDGFGTIRDGYYVPHSHELRFGACGRLLLLPVGAAGAEEALAVATVHGVPHASEPAI